MSKPNFEFLDALGQIARDKGISVETLLDALANALVAAYKRRPDAAEEAVVTIDPESGEIRVYGQELDEDGNVIREWDDTPDDFGRIAAQTAKQVILQRIREVERDLKYEEYAGREGDIVTGIVQQTDNRYTLLDLGKVEALLPQAEQVSYERYEHGARLKAYIVEVRKTTKGPQIVVSRSHPGLIKRLFELEVPEISSGAVEIKAAAREPGHRTKIAVWSNDPNVDPVGACVGARGSRVRMVTNELRGERVDVVPFSDDPVELIQSALAPARVREVRLDDDTGTATVIVSDYQLSLAIGKEGQNARLAARLTGWRIDIKSETQLADEESGYSARSGPRASGSRTKPGRWCGSLPRAARRCRLPNGRRGPKGWRRPLLLREIRSPMKRPRSPPAALPVQSIPTLRREPVEPPRKLRPRCPAKPRPRCPAPMRAGGPRHSPTTDLHRLPTDPFDGRTGPVGPPGLGGVVGQPDAAGPGRMAVPGVAGMPGAGGEAERLQPGVASRRRPCSGRPAAVRVGIPTGGVGWVGLGRCRPVMCEDRGSYVRIGTYDVKEGQ